jgi:ABC-type transport system substrate-binding protein
MSHQMMSSFLSVKMCSLPRLLVLFSIFITACQMEPLNNPYRPVKPGVSVLYSSFAERPKHLDPARAYSSNEYTFIAQIYEPPLQYHYLKRPYQLIPLTAGQMPQVLYYNADGQQVTGLDPDQVAYSDYLITLKKGIHYQPHPAFSRDKAGHYRYHHLSKQQLDAIETLADFTQVASRELTAEDYVYQIKRLAHPAIQSPIAGIMKNYIVGFEAFAKTVADKPLTFLSQAKLDSVTALGRYQYRVRIKGKYPQFRFWLAMPFFAPMPWEADAFYQQAGLKEKNITLDWYPVGTGPYQLTENNPNRRMVLEKNPLFHEEFYPNAGEAGDKQRGLLVDRGKKLPFIDRVIYVLEKENIPYWNKFLQGYYDASGIASDSFDQAVQFTGEGDAQLTPMMQQKGIQLQTAVMTSVFYMGFNMLDPVIGGYSERARKLRQAISIALNYEEYIAIFMNGRGVPAQGVLPPGIYGYQSGKDGINPYVYDWDGQKARRKPIDYARQLMAEAGYSNGIDPKTGEALSLYFDTASASIDERPRMNWFRKQFAKLGIKLIIRATDYNRFQQKMRTGSGQLFTWGWNADYPDPENFFFLLYGPNSKVQYGGENAVNYQNPEYDHLFEQMRNMDNGPQRLAIIRQMQEILRRDAPWVFGVNPKSFSLFHGWYHNIKPNLMANNRLKYTRLDVDLRETKRRQWNQPVFWPLLLILVLLVLAIYPAVQAYRRRLQETIE